MQSSVRSLLPLGVCLGSILPPQCARAEAPFPEVLNPGSSLSLQGPAHHVQDVRLSSGHVTLVLTSGNAAPVVAGSEVVGLFFRGQGSLEYVSVDPVEFPIVSYNTRKNTGLKAVSEGNTLVIRDK